MALLRVEMNRKRKKYYFISKESLSKTHLKYYFMYIFII